MLVDYVTSDGLFFHFSLDTDFIRLKPDINMPKAPKTPKSRKCKGPDDPVLGQKCIYFEY